MTNLPFTITCSIPSANCLGSALVAGAGATVCYFAHNHFAKKQTEGEKGD